MEQIGTMNSENRRSFTESNVYLDVAVLSLLGSRDEQQDSFGVLIKNEDGAFVICDGMGGQNHGRRASNTTVDQFLAEYNRQYPIQDLRNMLCDTVIGIDQSLSQMTDSEGRLLYAGTTLAAAVIQEKHLNWVSVGDSRIYLFRQGHMIRITNDHNYQYVLDSRLKDHTISEEGYLEESKKGEQLVSFIGMGGLAFIDSSNYSVPLEKEDIILICSDGLYRMIKDEEIVTVLKNIKDIRRALEALEQKVLRRERTSGYQMDNTTMLLVKIK